jgi:hypothetical protein
MVKQLLTSLSHNKNISKSTTKLTLTNLYLTLQKNLSFYRQGGASDRDTEDEASANDGRGCVGNEASGNEGSQRSRGGIPSDARTSPSKTISRR